MTNADWGDPLLPIFIHSVLFHAFCVHCPILSFFRFLNRNTFRVKGGQDAPLESSASLFSCPKYLFTFLSSFRENEKAMLRTQYREFVKIETVEAKIMNFWAFSKFLYGITPPPPTYFYRGKIISNHKRRRTG